MKCNNCGNQTNKTSTAYIKGKKIEFCSNCKGNFQDLIEENEDYKKTMTYGEGGKYTIGVAHYKDIKRRKYDWKTGDVYIDKGRKFI